MDVLFPPETSLPTASLFITLHWAHHILSLLGCAKAEACLKWLKVGIGLLTTPLRLYYRFQVTRVAVVVFAYLAAETPRAKPLAPPQPSPRKPWTNSKKMKNLWQVERASDNATQVSGGIQMFLSDPVKSGLELGHKLNIQIPKLSRFGFYLCHLRAIKKRT